MNPELLFHLKSLTRCMFYVTDEEDRFLAKLCNTLKKYEDQTSVYNAIYGLVPIKQLVRSWGTRSAPVNADTQNIHDALAKVYSDDPREGQNFYIITDPDRWLPDPQVQRRLLNIFHQLHNDDRTIKVLIFVGNRLVVPPKLQRYIEVIHDKGLSEEEINELVQEVSQKLKIPPPKDVAKNFRGLTSYEVDAAIAQSITLTKKDPKNPKRIDTKVIADFKRRQLAKTDLIDYVDVSQFSFDQVGGNDQFKAWANKTKASWTDEGQRFGLRPPKGVLAVGVWGCIAEGTRIDYRRGARVSCRGRSLPIEELFEKFNDIKGSARPGFPWLPNLTTYLQSWDAGTGSIVFNEMLGITDSGSKECLRITTDTGTLELTGDHPVLVQGGTFRPAQDLKPDDILIVRGSMKVTGPKARKTHNTKKRVIIEGLKYHPVAWKKATVDPATGVKYTYGRTTRARLVFEARMNNLQYEEYLQILKKDPEVAETLIYLPAEYDVHHIDEDVTNDVFENLMLLTHERQAQLHWECASTNNHREFTRESRVITVQAIGPRRTFDVEMREPYTNFAVSGGMIVHNCGKSLSVKAMGHAWKLPVIQLEMGRLRSSAVGESEANVYRAINLIESVAPCVTGETEVTLADGSTLPIEDLWQDTPDDLRVKCWNEKTLRVDTTRVTAVTRREADTFKVKAANGYRVNATANHLHYVLRGDMPEWVRTDDLERGDMLAVPISKYSGEDDCARFHPAGMRLYDRGDGLQDFRRGGGGFRDAVVQKLPVKWTTELGWLLGIIEGDGFIGVNDGIGLTNTSKVLLSAFEGILAGLFGLSAVRHQHILEDMPNLPGLSAEPEFQPCWTTSAQNQLAAEFLRAARAAILTAPPQVRAAFLAGWVDADGCVGSNKVTLTVKGPKLRKERRFLARQLVQSLGVVPSKFESKNMEITGSRARNLAGVLVEHLRLKGTKAAEVTSSDVGFDRGMGFACGAMLSEARRIFSIATIQDKGISTGVMWRHENGMTPISERYMKKYAELVGVAGPGFRKLLEAECRWVEVQSVKSLGQRVVYDLACEGEDTHSFFANGLITHNCLVWVDEAEKSLSGGQSSAMSDAGTTSRVIGILSNWLQETEAHVCLAMTANSLRTLPIEFVNRMDERFFFDLPSEEERVEILKIHLKKRNRDPAEFQLAELAEGAVNMVGREIEQAIGAALVDSFDAGCESLSQEILLKELAGKPRIFKTMVDELREVLDWVGYDPDIGDGIRARFASARRSETFKKFQSNPEG